MRYTDWRHPFASDSDIFLQYGNVYGDAIERIFQSFKDNVPRHDYSMLPVIALLRHFIELTLKGIIYHCQGQNYEQIIHHKINELWDQAVNEVQRRYYAPDLLNQVDPIVIKFIISLVKFDNFNEFGRYPQRRNGEPIRYSNMDNWLYTIVTDIARLYETSKLIIDSLEGFGIYIQELESHESDMRREFGDLIRE